MKTYIDDLPATLAAMWQRQPTRRAEIIGMLTEFVASHPVAHRECPLAARMVNLSAKAKPAKAKRSLLAVVNIGGVDYKVHTFKAKCEQKRARDQK
jgi:hypothetical protein